jgi:hypothetical protein
MSDSDIESGSDFRVFVEAARGKREGGSRVWFRLRLI